MKKIFICLLLLFPFVGSGQSYNIKSNDSYVEFYFVSKDVHGTMSGINASIEMDFDNLANSKVVGSAMVSTLDTKNEGRDHHLQADDMFDAEKFPLMKFESKMASVQGDKSKVEGELTIRDVSKVVVFDVTNENGTLIFATEINSADYGVEIKSKYEDNLVQVSVFVPVK